MTNSAFSEILYWKTICCADKVKAVVTFDIIFMEAFMEPIVHPIPPIFDSHSEILILGSFPSVKSREGCFFYHHPQNRFWKVLAQVVSSPLPQTIDEKKAFLLKNHIAVWDVIASCTIEGSSDSSIRNVIPNDLSDILEHAPVKQICCNGKASFRYYRKYQEKVTGRQALCLPSTSPANAAWSLAALVEEWAQIRSFLTGLPLTGLPPLPGPSLSG